MPKSTLTEANEKRDWRIHRDYAQWFIGEAKTLYIKDIFRLGLDEMVYAFDSSTIKLYLKLCPWAKFHYGRGAMKMHILMDLRGSILSFVELIEGNVHDSRMMKTIPAEVGSYYLMNKGYVDLKSLYNHFQQNNAFFVTRAKDNMAYEVIYSREVDANAGLISDETIRLTGYLSVRRYPDSLRLVVYEDSATAVVYRPLTNNFSLEALTIAELYRER